MRVLFFFHLSRGLEMRSIRKVRGPAWGGGGGGSVVYETASTVFLPHLDSFFNLLFMCERLESVGLGRPTFFVPPPPPPPPPPHLLPVLVSPPRKWRCGLEKYSSDGKEREKEGKKGEAGLNFILDYTFLLLFLK